MMPVRLRPLSTLLRTGTVLAGAVLCVLGGRLSGGGDPLRLALATVLVACCVAFAQVVNDVADVEVDRLGKPHRPLAAQEISVPTAQAVATGLGVTAVVAGVALGPGFVVVALALLALSWGYSHRWKSTVVVGNLVVAGLASTPLPIGAAAGQGVTPLVLAAQLLVLLFMAAFEVVKTGIDHDGDASAGLRTVATVRGARSSAVLGSALTLAFVVAIAVPAGLSPRPLAFASVIVPAAAVPALVAATQLLTRGFQPDDLRPPFRLLRWAWLGGIAAIGVL